MITYVNISIHDSLKETATLLVRTILQFSDLLLQLQNSGAFREKGCSSARHYAASMLGIPVSEVRRFLRVARQLRELPNVRAAAEEGRIGWHAVHTVAQHATPDTEKRWLEIAESTTPEQLQDIVRTAEEKAGIVRVHWKLQSVTLRMVEEAWKELSENAGHPLTRDESLQQMAARVLTGQVEVSEAELERLVQEAQKDVEAIERTPDGAPPEVASNAAPHGMTVTLTEIGSVPFGKKSRLRFNPKARVVTPAQRRELLRRERFVCATPGCCNCLWLHVHHIEFHSEGGETTPGNLVLLCSACHRLVHLRQLVIRGEAPAHLRFFDPQGELLRGSGAPLADTS